ncbi:hypothetical protein ADK57_45870 [Streptomyces sp. MMG1533]|uniref:hypothetical protein n=1 Tax=Streptomyces sp. MMG1533 TaxID=1415546 RepID=UPI0006ADD93D|nr:hypothetical protein [Streptomyces sp. MMG1533]KOU55070.1 hypothetical protein ADK57_45870 [Streptomyces sp. MMG1533]
MKPLIGRTRFGRTWLRGLTALALGLTLSLGAVQPSTADDHRPPGAAEGVDLSKEFKNPLTSPLLLPVFQLRLKLYEVLLKSRPKYAYLAFDEYRNGASDLIDPRKLNQEQLATLLKGNVRSTGRVWQGTMVDLSAVGTYLNSKDLADLQKSGESRLVALSALNVQGKEHSEGVIDAVLNGLHISPQAKRAGSSEHQQCWECANFYHPDTPTHFAADYDINSAEVKDLDSKIISIEEQGKKRGFRESEINKQISKTIAEFEKKTKERNRQAARKLHGYIVDAKKSAEDSVGKVGKQLGSVMSNPATPCPPGQSPQAGGAPAKGFMLAAAAADPCGGKESSTSSAPLTGLSQALAVPGTAPGGIDFSSMQLRYLSDPGDGSGLQYSFQAQRDPMNGDLRASTGLNAARLTSDAFFVWLSLNPSDFWVNLNPDEPDRIVDDQLGRTDAGRVMLEADLRMKKTVGELIHPHTALGRKFWDGVQGDCMSFRNWILPAPASVHQDGDKLYILHAPLDVQMETQYLERLGESDTATCPEQDQATEDRNEEHFRTLILPKLKHAINTAPEYAALRRVYLARVAAEWYRELSRAKDTTYGDLIDSGDIDGWQTTADWKPTDTFDKYVDSYKKGEFKVTDRTTSGNTTYVHTYVYGGVDLTGISIKKVADERFTADFAGLPQSIDRSLKAPSSADGDDTVWLGSPTPRQAAGLGPPEEPVSAGTWALRLLPVLLLPLLALLWRRRRRLNTAAQASPLRRAAVGSGGGEGRASGGRG